MPFRIKKVRRSYSRLWQRTNKYSKKIRRNWNLKSKYGISQTEFEKMHKRQKGRCAICNAKTKLTVDHDHKTTQVRGLLCLKCNAALGMLADSISNLQAAIFYLTHAANHLS